LTGTVQSYLTIEAVPHSELFGCCNHP